MGQAELARVAGIAHTTLWQIEHHRRTPRPATIRKIAVALGVSPQELISETGEQSTD